MIGLPTAPRRAEILAFWILVNGGSLLLLPWTIALLIGNRLAIVALVSILVLSIAGFINRSIAKHTYNVWNRWANRVSRVVYRILSYACYLVIGAYGRLLKSEFRESLRPDHAELGWIKKQSASTDDYFSTWVAPNTPSSENWLKDMLTWSVSTKNYWTLAIVPYVVLLHLVKAVDRRPTYSNVYTLF